MTNIRSLTVKLQRLLRLQDWVVGVKFVRRHEFSDPDSQAEIIVTTNLKRACIRLMDPRDADQDHQTTPYEVLPSLVHELLHLHFKFLDEVIENSEPMKLMLEQAIESIATGLAAALEAQINAKKINGKKKPMKGKR